MAVLSGISVTCGSAGGPDAVNTSQPIFSAPLQWSWESAVQGVSPKIEGNTGGGTPVLHMLSSLAGWWWLDTSSSSAALAAGKRSPIQAGVPLDVFARPGQYLHFEPQA